MKDQYLAFVFIILISNLYSQNVEGIIVNAATSRPVENVNITNLDTGDGTSSDAEGNFSFRIENFPATLRFSAVGFETRQRVVRQPGDLVVYLFPTAENLSEVIIRSTLISKELRKIPAAISVITTQDLQKIDPTNLSSAFNNVPGVYVNQGALNTTKINIRGIGARSQYSTNRIQAYFNGIPLTTAEGELTLDDIDPEALSRIEIIKGPTSSIYGAGLGGVINLYAGQPSPGTKASAKYLFGSFNMVKKNYSASQNTANTSLFINYSDLETNGFRENGDYDRNSALVSSSLTTETDNKINFLANFTRLKAFIPSSINETDFRNNPSVAASNWAAAQGFESYDQGLLGVSYEHSISTSVTNVTSVFVNFRDAFEPRPFDILKEERISAGARTRFNWVHTLFNRESQLSVGAEYHNEWYETGTFENLYREFENRGSVLGERLSNNEQDRNYSNFFGQIAVDFSEDLTVEAGVNLNITRYSLNDLYVQDEVDQTGDYGFDPVLSPRIGINYEVAEAKNVYASISHGFSTPTVAETLTPEGTINTNLAPETGINYEVGFKGNWLNNSLYTEVALYTIQINDLLVARRVAEDRYVGINAGKTNHNGIEFLASYNFSPFSKFSFNPYIKGSINEFKFDDFEDRGNNFAGNRIPGVPKRTFNAGLDINYLNFNFYSNYLAVGEIPLNDANALSTNSYEVLDLKVNYNWAIIGDFQLTLTAGVNNVLDEKYAASVLPNALGFGGAAPRYYYPGNPRNYYGGVGLNYQF